MAAEALSLFGWREQRRGPTQTQPTGQVSLRDYQREAYSRILEGLSVNTSVLLVLATGGGKTTIFGAVARDWRGRVLVLAHRSELLDQARARLQSLTGESVGLEQADCWAGSQRIVVGSVQTLGTKADYRRRRFGAKPFDLIIIDEAHHAVAKTYRAVIDTFPEARVLGVTATPDRGDQVALGKIFETTIGPWDYLDLRNEGYLVPVEALTIELGTVNLEHVEARGKADLNIGQLDREMQKGNERIAAKTLELAQGRKTIVFVPGVEGAHLLAATFNRDRRCAVVVDGKTPADQRRDLLAQHARGDVQVLVNVGIATEGYDCPAVSCVAIARPTKSRALYAQMAGRGGRVLPDLVDGVDLPTERKALIAASAKPDMLLLDFVGQAGRHKLVSPADILGGKDVDPEALARAARMLRKRAGRPDEVVAAAKEQLQRERQAREARVMDIRATVAAGERRVDPFGDRPWFDEEGKPFVPVEPVKDLPFVVRGKPMSQGLRYALGHMGFAAAALDVLDHAAAVKLLRHEKVRQARGLAGQRAIGELARYGVQAREMYADKATEVLNAIRANRGKPLEPGALDAIVRKTRAPGEEG